MFCPSCGQPVSGDARFCPACGRALPEAASGTAPPAPVAGGITTGVPATAAALPLRPAGFWRRFWGLIVDRFVIGIVLFPIGMLFGIQFLAWPRWDAETFGVEQLVALIAGSLTMLLIRTVVEWLYAALLQSSSRQATLGQMLLGLKVTDLDGRRISFARASGRHVASFLSALILCIGYLMCAFTAKKQTLHDLIASTLVLRT
jgi:uncharacterized RDD family membrane protein YckC